MNHGEHGVTPYERSRFREADFPTTENTDKQTAKAGATPEKDSAMPLVTKPNTAARSLPRRFFLAAI
jgi:hypothetical protein